MVTTFQSTHSVLHYSWHVAASSLHSSTSSLLILRLRYQKTVTRLVFLCTLVSSFSYKFEQELNNWLDPPPYGQGLDRQFSADSCADIYPTNSFGYYWLNAGLQPKQVYCSINENPCCNDSDAKWMRIAYLNMSHPTILLHNAHILGQSWTHQFVHTCQRQFNTSISSVNYSSYGIPYSKVCGRILQHVSAVCNVRSILWLQWPKSENN